LYSSPSRIIRVYSERRRAGIGISSAWCEGRRLMSGTSRAAHLAAVTIRWASDAVRIAEKTVGPLLDVFIRLWLAGIFWASGMV